MEKYNKFECIVAGLITKAAIFSQFTEFTCDSYYISYVPPNNMAISDLMVLDDLWGVGKADLQWAVLTAIGNYNKFQLCSYVNLLWGFDVRLKLVFTVISSDVIIINNWNHMKHIKNLKNIKNYTSQID